MKNINLKGETMTEQSRKVCRLCLNIKNIDIGKELCNQCESIDIIDV